MLGESRFPAPSLGQIGDSDNQKCRTSPSNAGGHGGNKVTTGREPLCYAFNLNLKIFSSMLQAQLKVERREMKQILSPSFFNNYLSFVRLFFLHCPSPPCFIHLLRGLQPTLAIFLEHLKANLRHHGCYFIHKYLNIYLCKTWTSKPLSLCHHIITFNWINHFLLLSKSQPMFTFLQLFRFIDLNFFFLFTQVKLKQEQGMHLSFIQSIFSMSSVL